MKTFDDFVKQHNLGTPATISHVFWASAAWLAAMEEALRLVQSGLPLEAIEAELKKAAGQE